nr:MAG TPA: hypothetical protein [Caudoviricetes sp.]
MRRKICKYLDILRKKMYNMLVLPFCYPPNKF